MTATAPTTSAGTARVRLRWWREVVYIAVFYGVYTAIRNHGIAADASGAAFHHAKQMIGVERAVGLFHEESLQDAFLGTKWFIQFWNIFYGTAHFVVTVVAIVLLFRRQPERYPRWRNTLAVTTGLALIGFAFYPLMPPRLLPSTYGFVDTLRAYGGLWSFDSGAMSKISNQYAAMPSLHFGWSSWCACVLVPMVRHRWSKVLMGCYPFVTLFAIMVTANHYWIDALGGATVLTIGYLLGGRLLTEQLERRAA